MGRITQLTLFVTNLPSLLLLCDSLLPPSFILSEVLITIAFPKVGTSYIHSFIQNIDKNACVPLFKYHLTEECRALLLPTSFCYHPAWNKSLSCALHLFALSKTWLFAKIWAFNTRGNVSAVCVITCHSKYHAFLTPSNYTLLTPWIDNQIHGGHTCTQTRLPTRHFILERFIAIKRSAKGQEVHFLQCGCRVQAFRFVYKSLPLRSMLGFWSTILADRYA